MACVASQGQQPGYQSHEPPSPPSAAPPPGPAAMPACAGSSSSSSSSCGLPPEEEAVLDRIIAELLSVKDARPGTEVHLAEEDIHWVIRRCRETFLQQPMLLEVACPVNVCGDTHGQYHDLLRLFEMGDFPPYSNYIFLGDYVDRAKQSIETMSLLMCYKVKYPESFFLLRGNHECASLNRIYGFYDECKRRYSIKLWRTFSDLFNCMPVAAVIEDKIFCMHGGLSPELRHLSQILQLPRPVDVPDEGILCDLLWSDPDPGIDGWARNPRGVSYLFGHDVVAEFLATHDLDLICRAHQVVEDGYEFQAARQLVTLFSAPNYCGEFDNAGAMMCVNEDLVCSFRVLRPASMGEDTTATNAAAALASASASAAMAAAMAATTAGSSGEPTSPTNGASTRSDYDAPSVASGRVFVAQRRQEAKGDAIAAMTAGGAKGGAPLRRPVRRRVGRQEPDDLFDVGEGVESLGFGEGEDDLDDLGF